MNLLKRLCIILIFLSIFSLISLRTVNPQPTLTRTLLATQEMKTLLNGHFYWLRPNPLNPPPSGLQPIWLKIEMLFNVGGSIGDQIGGISPYPTLREWPDGKVDMRDISFVAKHFGIYESGVGWDYMADVNPDRLININDIGWAARAYGMGAEYLSWPQTGVTVVFGSYVQTPDADGYVLIPDLSSDFTVYKDGVAIGAFLTFWADV